jgi:hypothetical protein
MLGRPEISSQCMFGTALQVERDLGIDFWSADCPAIDGIQLTVPGPDDGRALHWAARLWKADTVALGRR